MANIERNDIQVHAGIRLKLYCAKWDSRNRLILPYISAPKPRGGGGVRGATEPPRNPSQNLFLSLLAECPCYQYKTTSAVLNG